MVNGLTLVCVFFLLWFVPVTLVTAVRGQAISWQNFVIVAACGTFLFWRFVLRGMGL